VTDTTLPVVEDDDTDQTDIDQILAEATPEQRKIAEAYADEVLEKDGETRTWEAIVADKIIELDEAEGAQEARRRLSGQSKQIDTEQKTEATRAHEARQDMYPEWWDEYREAVAQNKIKATQTARVLFFLQKGMLVKDVAKMLGIRYQIVYQIASWNELAGPREDQVTCQVCGRPLTQPNSTTRKIGPICAKGGKHK
jgi:hypothetical protein